MPEKFTIPRLLSLRLENNLLQRNVSDYLGCTQQCYSKYELGELQLPLPYLIKLTFFYDASSDFILGLTDIRKRPAPSINY